MDLHSYSRSLTLKNGDAILVRAIRPDDRERLRHAFALDLHVLFWRQAWAE